MFSAHGEPIHEPERKGEVAEVEKKVVVHQRKSRVTPGLLAIFLGWVGAHRFYLGSPWIGVAQIGATLLTVGVVGIIWGIVEGILIFMRKSITQDAYGNPLV